MLAPGEEASGGMNYTDIASLTLEAVLQTVVVCLVGYWASTQGYLNRSAQKTISNLNVMVFTPCLVFSKMASQLSVSAMVDIAIIPVIFVISTGVSFYCGKMCSRFFNFNKRETNFVIAMAVFGNSNSVPVSLFLNLAASLPALQWPNIPGDDADNVASRGLLYLLIFQQLGQMLRWSWGFYTLLAPEPLPETEENVQQANASQSSTSSNGNEVGAAKPPLYKTIITDIQNFMNPPLWAMLAAIIVASIAPLKDLLYGEKEGFVSRTVGLGIKQCGSTAVPLILVVLGSNLAPPSPEEAPLVQKSQNYSKLILASLISRMILPCLVLLPMITLAVNYLGISILDDPAFLVSTFILTASPPAIQLSQICQLNNVFEAEMAGVLFWGYCVLSLPSAVAIVLIALRVLDWTDLSRSSVDYVINMVSQITLR